MGFQERVKVVIDVVGDGATTGLSKFRRDLKESEGVVGKFKTTSAGAFDYVKANATQFALGAGTALVAFGAKSVQAFTDGALAAGQMADATGLSTEAASKWISAAGDLGIEGKSVEKIFLRLNKEIAEGGGVVEQYGIKVARTADGQVDANQTMLNAIGVVNKIPDTTERARVAQEIFGRSYADVAELIFQDADKVNEALESTSEQQIFDDDEVDKARQMRESMDRLQDAVTDFMLIVGEQLTPAIAELGATVADVEATFDDAADLIPNWAKDAYEAWDKYLSPRVLMTGPAKLVSGIGSLFDGGDGTNSAPAKWVRDVVAEFKSSTGEMVDEAAEGATAYTELEDGAGEYTLAQNLVNESITEGTEAWREQREAMHEARVESRRLADQTFDLWDAEKDLARAIDKASDTLKDQDADLYDVRDAMIGVARGADAVAAKQVELEGHTLDSEAGMRVWNQSMLTSASTMKGPMRQAVLDHIARVNGIPHERITDFRAAVDGGSIKSAEDILNWLARPRSSTLTVHTSNVPGGHDYYAAGTEFAPGGSAIVGEEGPELVQLPHGSKVTNARQTADRLAGAGGPTSIAYITQHFPAGTRPDDVVRAQRRYNHRNGT